jgi:hypothetical protein
MHKYVRSCIPLQTAEESKKTDQAAREFLASGSIGRTLQERLIARDQKLAKAGTGENWLQRFAICIERFASVWQYQ